MSIPLLNVTPASQNQRVEGYEVPDEDDPIAYRLTNVSSDFELNEIIWAGYRQIFSEHLILETYRQPFLSRSSEIGRFLSESSSGDWARRMSIDSWWQKPTTTIA